MMRTVQRFWRGGVMLGLVTALAVTPGALFVVVSADRITDTLLLGLAVTVALAGVVTALVTIQQVSHPMNAILSRIQGMTAGDFTTRIHVGWDGGMLARIIQALDDLAGVVEQRRAAAMAAERRYRTLYERSPVALYRTRLDGRIVDCNPAALRLLGYASLIDVITRNVVTFYVDPADRADVLARLARHEPVASLPLCLRRKDGSEVSVLLTAVRTEELGQVYVDAAIVDAATVPRQSSQSSSLSFRGR